MMLPTGRGEDDATKRDLWFAGGCHDRSSGSDWSRGHGAHPTSGDRHKLFLRTGLFGALVGCSVLACVSISCNGGSGSVEGTDGASRTDASDASSERVADPIASCDGGAAHTAIDPKNCGRCHHDCLGGVCSGGVCMPIALATKQSQVSGLATNGIEVFWSDGVEVKKCAVGGCMDTPTSVAIGNNPSSVAVDATNVYWSTHNAIMTCTTSNCSNPTIAASDPNGPGAIALDSTNVYWANGTGNVMSCPTSGGCSSDGGIAPTTLASGQGVIRGIAVDSTNVYWASDTGDVRSCATAGCGGTPTTLASNQLGVRGIAVDAANVYWTIFTMPGQVMKCARAGCGGNPTTLASGQYYPRRIASDGTTVFWTNYGPPVYYAGEVRECTAAGCDGDAGILARQNDRPADLIAIDTTAVYFSDNINQGSVLMKVAK